MRRTCKCAVPCVRSRAKKRGKWEVGGGKGGGMALVYIGSVCMCVSDALWHARHERHTFLTPLPPPRERARTHTCALVCVCVCVCTGKSPQHAADIMAWTPPLKKILSIIINIIADY